MNNLSLNIDNTILLAFIKGLKVASIKSEGENIYIFNNEKYQLKDIKIQSRRSQFYYFINSNNPTDIKIVKYSGGIPLYDGFNNVEFDKAERLRAWKKLYYKTTIKKKRAKVNAIKKKLKLEAKLEIIEQTKLEQEAKLKPIKCKFCNKEFKPTQVQQEFCCSNCSIMKEV